MWLFNVIVLPYIFYFVLPACCCGRGAKKNENRRGKKSNAGERTSDDESISSISKTVTASVVSPVAAPQPAKFESPKKLEIVVPEPKSAVRSVTPKSKTESMKVIQQPETDPDFTVNIYEWDKIFLTHACKKGASCKSCSDYRQNILRYHEIYHTAYSKKPANSKGQKLLAQRCKRLCDQGYRCQNGQLVAPPSAEKTNNPWSKRTLKPLVEKYLKEKEKSKKSAKDKTGDSGQYESLWMRMETIRQPEKRCQLLKTKRNRMDNM